MRVLIQRVKSGSVEVDNEIISKINQGIVLFVGELLLELEVLLFLFHKFLFYFFLYLS